MNWAGCWESTASPSRSHGKISVSSCHPDNIPTSRSKQQTLFMFQSFVCDDHEEPSGCGQTRWDHFLLFLFFRNPEFISLFYSWGCGTENHSESDLNSVCFFFFLCICCSHKKTKSLCFLQIHRVQLTQMQTTRERSQRWKHFNHNNKAWNTNIIDLHGGWNLWFQDAAGCSSPDRRSRRRRRRRSCRSSDPGEFLLLVKIKCCDAVA